jgi:hypothetical protein
MSLVPLNRLLSYSFRQLDLASGYGEGMIKTEDALTRNNTHHPFTGRTRDVPLSLFSYRGAAKDGGTLEYVFEAGEHNSPDARESG